VLRFLSDTRIEPTNNLAERDVRWAKTQQNTSGRLTSSEITAARLTARSYIATVIKHGNDALTAIRDAITGNPWTGQASALALTRPAGAEREARAGKPRSRRGAGGAALMNKSRIRQPSRPVTLRISVRHLRALVISSGSGL